MSELHLNSQVFDTFQRIAGDKTISAKDAQALKQAIEADGQIDDAEQTLLKSLSDPEHANSNLTISGEGDRKTTFSPAGLHFDGKAAAQLKSEFAATEHYSQGISQSWDKILKAKDGVFDAGDIDKLASQAKTPTDRSLIAALRQGINGGIVTGPDGMMIRTEAHGNGRRIVPQAVKEHLNTLIDYGMKARQPDQHALTQLLKALSSPSASVRKAAQEQTQAAMSQLTTEERSKLQSVIREHGLQRLSPDFMDQLAGAIKQGQRNDHAKYGEQLGSFLAANEAMEDPGQQAGAYKVLGESLRETGKKAGKSLGEDPNLARFATSMAKAEKSLKDKGVKLTTEQRGIWAEARYTTHPQKALAELENIALSPSKESPDPRDRSLKFLLEHSPNADEIGKQILAGKGQPSEAMRKLVAQNVHASVANYARLLKDPQSEVRIEALQGLSKVPQRRNRQATPGLLYPSRRRGPGAALDPLQPVGDLRQQRQGRRRGGKQGAQRACRNRRARVRPPAGRPGAGRGHPFQSREPAAAAESTL